jgi:hypothetical protein
MAAYWQGYGSLGVGAEAGAVTWGNRSLALSLPEWRCQEMAEVSACFPFLSLSKIFNCFDLHYRMLKCLIISSQLGEAKP